MLKTLSYPGKKRKQIGPADAGRRMSVAEFDLIDGQEGYLYELNKGIIKVTNIIPHRRHFVQQMGLLEQLLERLIVYKSQTPQIVHAVGTSDSTKVLMEKEQSERHPDVAVYTTSMPEPMPDVDENLVHLGSDHCSGSGQRKLDQTRLRRQARRIPSVWHLRILDRRRVQKIR
jgi:hypothetical protein